MPKTLWQVGHIFIFKIYAAGASGTTDSATLDVMYLVISTSLSPVSRSHLMAVEAARIFEGHQQPVQLVDLRSTVLPSCDADTCYGHPEVIQLAGQIREASAILLATPVYNYDVGSAAKNLVELTGQAWNDKIVGFLCAAGGRGSYMATVGFAGSLMLDFHCLIVPRIAYATPEAFNDEDRIADPQLQQRLEAVVGETIRLSQALKGAAPLAAPK